MECGQRGPSRWKQRSHDEDADWYVREILHLICELKFDAQYRTVFTVACTCIILQFVSGNFSYTSTLDLLTFLVLSDIHPHYLFSHFIPNFNIDTHCIMFL